MIAPHPLAILEQALAWIAQGQRVVLVTLVGIEGSTSRGLGSQMAVAEDGRFAGSFSGGCIEDAIVAEARDVLAARAGRTVRYGAGSPYIDVRLPCGGGIDLCFTPDPEAAVLAGAVAELHARRAVVLPVAEDGVGGEGFPLHLAPVMRIMGFGHGEDFTAFVRLARQFGALVEAYSPHERDVAVLGDATRLTHLGQPPALAGDDWTGFVFVFHDRDWEDALLPSVLTQPAFLIGAVGSRRTHAQRLERLAAAGVPPDLVARIKGPFGLIPATRDPATLALSILAEVAGAYPAPWVRAG